MYPVRFGYNRGVCSGISGKEISMKKQYVYVAAAILSAFCGAFFLGLHYKDGEKYSYVKENGQYKETEEVIDPSDLRTPVEGGQTGGAGAQAEEYCVFVCGQVQEEGICYLSAGSRIDDAIRKAGGFTEEADTNYWNLAAFVCDGQRIYVPKIGEITMYSDVTNAYDSMGRLDLNAATADMLTALPGIGEKRAADIIAYRLKAGRFTSVDELNEISGIKGSVYRDIKDLVCVR